MYNTSSLARLEYSADENTSYVLDTIANDTVNSLQFDDNISTIAPNLFYTQNVNQYWQHLNLYNIPNNRRYLYNPQTYEYSKYDTSNLKINNPYIVNNSNLKHTHKNDKIPTVQSTFSNIDENFVSTSIQCVTDESAVTDTDTITTINTVNNNINEKRIVNDIINVSDTTTDNDIINNYRKIKLEDINISKVEENIDIAIYPSIKEQINTNEINTLQKQISE